MKKQKEQSKGSRGVNIFVGIIDTLIAIFLLIFLIIKDSNNSTIIKIGWIGGYVFLVVAFGYFGILDLLPEKKEDKNE